MGEEMHVYFQNSIPQHPTRIETRSEGGKKKKRNQGQEIKHTNLRTAV
jgi:hypothetical protein